MASIRESQLATIHKGLHSTDGDDTDDIGWKVLVFDSVGKSILSPLISVEDLQAEGVTLHLAIDGHREALADVPAVYFCLPNDKNISLICDDISQHKYDEIILVFITPLPREYLERLAEASIQSSVQVRKVIDGYCNFVSLEHDLFALFGEKREKNSFTILHSEVSSDDQIQATMNGIVDGLFAAVVQLGSIPIIRCSTKHAAEQVAKQLASRIRSHLKDPHSTLFQEGIMSNGSFQRPVLIILDRHIDLATMMHHSWTYQALAHDLMGLELNRIVVEMKSEDGNTREQRQSLDQKDQFWHDNRGKPFPVVAEAIEDAFADYKERHQAIKALTGGDGTSDSDNFSSQTQNLKVALSALPEVTQQKERLDVHMAMLQNIMDNLRRRKLDDYFQMEEEIMSKKALTNPVQDLIQNPHAGTNEDRLRLYSIYYLDGELDEDTEKACEKALVEMGCNLDSLETLRKIKSMQSTELHGPISTSHSTSTLFSLANKTLSTGASLWKKGVKALMPTDGQLPITRIVDEVMSCSTQPSLSSDFLYIDPKSSESHSKSVPKGRQPFDQGIVFMVGGGNYVEYQNLVDYARRSEGARHIVYGTTELLSAESWLADLGHLSTEQAN